MKNLGTLFLFIFSTATAFAGELTFEQANAARIEVLKYLQDHFLNEGSDRIEIARNSKQEPSTLPMTAEFLVSWRDFNKSTRMIGATQVKVLNIADCNFIFRYSFVQGSTSKVDGKCDKVTVLEE